MSAASKFNPEVQFALKSKLYLRALRIAFDTLSLLQPVRLAA